MGKDWVSVKLRLKCDAAKRKRRTDKQQRNGNDETVFKYALKGAILDETTSRGESAREARHCGDTERTHADKNNN